MHPDCATISWNRKKLPNLSKSSLFNTKMILVALIFIYPNGNLHVQMITIQSLHVLYHDLFCVFPPGQTTTEGPGRYKYHFDDTLKPFSKLLEMTVFLLVLKFIAISGHSMCWLPHSFGYFIIQHQLIFLLTMQYSRILFTMSCHNIYSLMAIHWRKTYMFIWSLFKAFMFNIIKSFHLFFFQQRLQLQQVGTNTTSVALLNHFNELLSWSLPTPPVPLLRQKYTPISCHFMSWLPNSFGTSFMMHP